MKGHLPWQGLKANGKKEKYQKIMKKKLEIDISELCRGVPKEFEDFLRDVRSLKFTETPDYDRLRGRLVKAATPKLPGLGGDTLPSAFDSCIYDWYKHRSHPEEPPPPPPARGPNVDTVVRPLSDQERALLRLLQQKQPIVTRRGLRQEPPAGGAALGEASRVRQKQQPLTLSERQVNKVCAAAAGVPAGAAGRHSPSRVRREPRETKHTAADLSRPGVIPPRTPAPPPLRSSQLPNESLLINRTAAPAAAGPAAAVGGAPSIIESAAGGRGGSKKRTIETWGEPPPPIVRQREVISLQTQETRPYRRGYKATTAADVPPPAAGGRSLDKPTKQRLNSSKPTAAPPSRLCPNPAAAAADKCPIQPTVVKSRHYGSRTSSSGEMDDQPTRVTFKYNSNNVLVPAGSGSAQMHSLPPPQAVKPARRPRPAAAAAAVRTPPRRDMPPTTLRELRPPNAPATKRRMADDPEDDDAWRISQQELYRSCASLYRVRLENNSTDKSTSITRVVKAKLPVVVPPPAPMDLLRPAPLPEGFMFFGRSKLQYESVVPKSHPLLRNGSAANPDDAPGTAVSQKPEHTSHGTKLPVSGRPHTAVAAATSPATHQQQPQQLRESPPVTSSTSPGYQAPQSEARLVCMSSESARRYSPKQAESTPVGTTTTASLGQTHHGAVVPLNFPVAEQHGGRGAGQDQTSAAATVAESRLCSQNRHHMYSATTTRMAAQIPSGGTDHVLTCRTVPSHGSVFHLPKSDSLLLTTTTPVQQRCASHVFQRTDFNNNNLCGHNNWHSSPPPADCRYYPSAVPNTVIAACPKPRHGSIVPSSDDDIANQQHQRSSSFVVPPHRPLPLPSSLRTAPATAALSRVARSTTTSCLLGSRGHQAPRFVYPSTITAGTPATHRILLQASLDRRAFPSS